MSEKSYVLAIDNGTQSVRALLFDLEGNLLGKGKVELEAYYSKQPGWAEQDPEYYWASLGEACRLLWEQVSIDKRALFKRTSHFLPLNAYDDAARSCYPCACCCEYDSPWSAGPMD